MSRPKAGRTRVFALLVAVALAAAACGGDDGGDSSAETPGSTTSLTPKTGGTLTFAAYAQILGLDPLVALGNGTSGAIQMGTVYDTLMRYDIETKGYKPHLAESLTSNDTSTEWTLKLRPNVKFTDGTAFDATAVAFGVNRHRVGTTNGIPVANCAEYVACPSNTRSSNVYMALVKDVQAVDPLTVKFVLSEPWASFPYALAGEPGMIPSMTAVKKCDGTKNPNTCEFNVKAVGAGPFMVQSFIPNDSINLVRNPNYWGGQVYLDGIKFVAFGDVGGEQTYEAFRTGGVDGAYLRTPSVVDKAKQTKVTAYSNIDQAGEMMLMNMGLTVTCAGGKPEPVCAGKADGRTKTTPVTANLKIRQAVAAAYDPSVFNQRVYEGKGLVGTELFQKSFPWSPGVAGPKYDLNQAKKLVSEAKAEGWDGNIRVLFTNSTNDAAAALALEAMLKAAGMNPIVDTTKDSAGQQAIVTAQKDFDLSRWGTSIGPDDSSIWAVAQNLSSTSTSNRPGFSSPKADQALKDLLSAKTDEQKTAAYKIIAEEFNALVPWINYMAVETLKVFSPKVHGVAPSHRNFLFFDKAWKE